MTDGVRRPFSALAVFTGATGLIALFGGQAFINILMNLQMFPSKGMTLPLVSYGGTQLMILLMAFGIVQSAHVNRPR